MPTRRSARNPTTTLKALAAAMPAAMASQTFAKRAAGQKIGGDKSAGAVERRLAERQKPGAAEQQIEAEAENSPDQDAGEQIDRAEPGIEAERQHHQRDRHREFGQPARQPAPVGRAHHARPMVPNRPRGRTIRTSVITA